MTCSRRTALSLLIMAVASSSTASTVEEILALTGSALVAIEVGYANRSPQKVGLGVIVDKHQIATTCNLVVGGTSFRLFRVAIEKERANPVRVTPTRFDGRRNVCLLRAYLPNAKPIQRRVATTLRAGESVLALSMSQHNKPPDRKIETGVGSVLALVGFDKSENALIQTDISSQLQRPLRVVLDDRGRLVGLHIFGRNTEISYVIPVAWIERAMKEGLASQKTNHIVSVGNDWLLVAALLQDLSSENITKLVEHSERWLERYAASKDAGYYLGLGYALQGRPRQALSRFRKVLKIAAQDPYVWYQIGNQYHRINQWEDAVRSYQKALKIKANLVPVLTAYARVLHEQGSYQQAFDLFRQAVSIRPDRADAWHGVAQIMQRSGQQQDALNAYRQAVQFAPKNKVYHKDLAAMLDAVGEYQQALQSSMDALRLDEKYADALVVMGSILLHQNNIRQAIDSYQKAIQIDAQSELAWYGLGVLYGKTGNRKQVVSIYEKLQTLNSPKAAGLYKNFIQR